MTVLPTAAGPDADIIITNGAPDNENIRYLELGRQEYVLLMSGNHPLAHQEGLWLKDLREEKFICDSSRMNLSKLQSLCRQQGFEPKVAYEVESSAADFPAFGAQFWDFVHANRAGAQNSSNLF